MKTTKHLASHFRGVFFGGNWTDSNLKNQLAEVSLKDATTKIQDCNTILALTFHIGYYVTGVLEVFNDRPLLIKDKFSYKHAEISTAEDWQSLCDTIFKHAETLAKHIETLPEEHIWDDFSDAKYGNYYRNILGIIEHTHYHLGQIALLKKLVRPK